jgi:hypothetical protein
LKFGQLPLETFNPVYHALEGLDGFLRVLTGRLSIFCKVVRGCLYGSELTLDVLLSGTKYFTVVFVRNPSERLFKDQKAFQVRFAGGHQVIAEEWN